MNIIQYSLVTLKGLAQRVNASGAVQWTADGVAICTAPNSQSRPVVTSDGSHGAIISWSDDRGIGTYDIYAQRINASGVVQWAANGVPICTAPNYQLLPEIISDGSGGAIITWHDGRSGLYDIYAQRINSSGAVQWTANGVAICSATNDQNNSKITSDGSGGAIITWWDLRSGIDIYAQRINSSGAVQWTANGVAISTESNNQYPPNIASDGNGGAIITWHDDRNGNWDIYAQRINTNGTLTTITTQFWGVWTDGVWSWNQSTKQWTKMLSTANALMITAGKVDSDAVEDLIGLWSSGLWVRYSSTGQWLKLTANLPTWITAGDLNNDGRDDVIGSWKNDGVYYRNSANGKWVKVTAPAKQLAVGNIGGTRDDLSGVWDSGLWVCYSATGAWQKIDPTIPVWITTGDMTGNGRADIIGSYASGTWYRNSATGAWVKITIPADQLAAGDIDGDGREDLIGVWSSGVWVRYGATGQWLQITSSKPKWIIAGRVADAVQAVGSLEDPMESSDVMDVVDLSQEAPGGAASDGVLLEN
jgi:hypothetical protein